MARAGRNLALAALLVAALVLAGCKAASLEREARSIHGDRFEGLLVVDKPGLECSPQVTVYLKGTEAPPPSVMCRMLAAVAERSHEQSISVSYAMTQPDGTTLLVDLMWSPVTGDLIRCEGDSPGPHGEGLGTLYPVSHAKGISLEDLVEAGRGREITMTAWSPEDSQNQ